MCNGICFSTCSAAVSSFIPHNAWTKFVYTRNKRTVPSGKKLLIDGQLVLIGPWRAVYFCWPLYIDHESSPTLWGLILASHYKGLLNDY